MRCSCLRYYLSFTPELKSLLDAWGIGSVGSSAYRSGFCSRKLISQFSYVWLTILLLYVFVDPIRRMALTLPPVQSTIAAIRRKLASWSKDSADAEPEEPDVYAETLDSAFETQQELIQASSMLLTTFVFGPFVPILMVLAAVGVSNVWLERLSIKLDPWSIGVASTVHGRVDISAQPRPD